MRFLKKTSKTIDDVRAEKNDRIEALLNAAEQSRQELDSVATHTKEIAEDITLKLRNDLIDKMRQLELTANIINDALMICDDSGAVLFMNHLAESLLQQSLSPNHQINIRQYVKTSLPDFWDALVVNPDVAKVYRGDGSIVKGSLTVVRMEKTDETADYIVMLHLEDESLIEHVAIATKGTMLVRDGIISATNEEIENVLGYSQGDLQGTHLISMIAPAERPFVDQQLASHEMESTFDTVVLAQDGRKLFCKMAIAFVVLDSLVSAVVTIENIGEDIADRKVDVLRVFGEDFFFRSSTFVSDKDDMVIYLTPDLVIKYVNEPMRTRLVCDARDLTGVPLEDVLSATEYKIAKLHLQGLNANDRERTVSMHLKNTNANSYQEWTDRAYFDDHGFLLEYRRMGSFTN